MRVGEIGVGAAPGGDGRDRPQAEDDRLAVRQAVAALDLERVPERVAEVERPPLAALERVAVDDAELEPDRALDDRVAGRLVGARAPRGRAPR